MGSGVNPRVEGRLRRKKRIRKRVKGTEERPRLCVYRSLKHMYAQIIDDERGVTLVSASTLSPELRAELAEIKGKVEAAKKVGELLGKKALEKGISKVVFDRNGYKYHGRVRAVAEGARAAGLQF
ncbi:50S ribosomal protein L18 [Thermodesulforhabdus norvegica]|uniref:Large ribosomal subunit protein uL18 n=1 Tax=Thermodesulforhabdus norvegica TaxID=39841 RepID=A0A1I4VMH8_9BACT|nr:50S ribosomal protein L18 [Thermodesulforhabdus norvegica]SFN02474.1 LSU ribosomal protein L18P [Thermodesulforhabdus norvegica]